MRTDEQVKDRLVATAARADREETPLPLVYFSRQFPELSQTFVFNEMRALRDAGAHIRVIALNRETANPSDLPQRYGIDEVRYVASSSFDGRASRLVTMLSNALALPPKRLLRLPLALLQLKRSAVSQPLSTWLRLAMALQPGHEQPIIHCHFGTAGLIVAELKRTGLIDSRLTTVFHGYDLTQFLRSRSPRTYDVLFDQADLLIPISDRWHRQLLDLGAPPPKVETIRLGIDSAAFPYRERKLVPGTPCRFISIGRMTEKKGHYYTVEAFAAFRRRRPDLPATLDIVGAGPLLAELRDLVARRAPEGGITLHGGLPHDEVRALLSSAHVFVLPSITAADGDMEGIPVSIMEAMAVGLPVISTHHSGIPELVADGQSGLLVAERDIAALTDAMETLCAAPQTIAAMGAAGSAIVREHYDDRKQARLLKRVLDRLAGPVHASGALS